VWKFVQLIELKRFVNQIIEWNNILKNEIKKDLQKSFF